MMNMFLLRKKSETILSCEMYFSFDFIRLKKCTYIRIQMRFEGESMYVLNNNNKQHSHTYIHYVCKYVFILYNLTVWPLIALKTVDKKEFFVINLQKENGFLKENYFASERTKYSYSNIICFHHDIKIYLN